MQSSGQSWRRSRKADAEMALLLACCRWPVAGDAVRVQAGAATDWPRLLALARRHRVQGLVHHALDTTDVAVPAAVRAELADEARRIATRNLRLAAESVRLVRLVEAVGVPVLVVKGSALAMLAYGTLTVKMAWDIDLLVPADGVAAAADVLGAAGYACTLPGPDRGDLLPWHRFSKESVWRHAGSGLHAELHGALVDSPRVLPGLDARGPRQAVTIAAGLTLPTLAADALFAYLCVHGAASGWRRAKWLADVGALLAPLPPAEIARLYAVSQAMGAGRAAGQALLLCAYHLDLSLPDDLAVSLRRDRGLRVMTAMAARMLTDPHGFDDPAATATGTLPIHLMQAMILPGWRFAWSEWRRKAVPDPRVVGGLSRWARFAWPAMALARRVRPRPRA